MNMSDTFVVKKPTLTSVKSEETKINGWEEQQAKNAHHRALILRVLNDFPDGLTVQQIVAQELEYYGYTFLTDNRLRELRQKGWVVSEGEKPQVWKLTSREVNENE